MKYVVFKASRSYQGGQGYAGLSCKDAGVEPGKVYDSQKSAQADADKLAEVNPVGFKVEEYREYRP